MNREMKLAVLIDAENISTKYIDVILSKPIIWAMSFINGFMATGPHHRWRHGGRQFSIMPYSLFSNIVIRQEKFDRFGVNHRYDGFVIPKQSRWFLHCLFRQRFYPPGIAAQGIAEIRPRHGRKQDPPVFHLGMQ